MHQIMIELSILPDVHVTLCAVYFSLMGSVFIQQANDLRCILRVNYLKLGCRLSSETYIKPVCDVQR